jgi:hypothetical protein
MPSANQLTTIANSVSGVALPHSTTASATAGMISSASSFVGLANKKSDLVVEWTDSVFFVF